MPLHYILGDATNPIKKPALIAHICNDCKPGKWGAGFVMALSKKDLRPEKYYREWATKGELQGIKYALGNVQITPFSDDVVVANIIGQHGTKPSNGFPPIRYWAIRKGLKKVFTYAKNQKYPVFMPRIGAALAGGSWEEMEHIIKDTVGSAEAYVCTLPTEKDKWPDCIYEEISNPEQ